MIRLREGLHQDVRFALRSLRRERLSTLAILATLALGIGGTTAIFSVVNAVLLRPLSYPDPDRIVQLLSTGPWGSAPAATVAKFNFWRQQAGVFQDVAAYDAFFGLPVLNLVHGETPEPLKAMRVTEGYFRLFGAAVVLGRAFTADEYRLSGPHAVLLSHALWEQRFGADPAISGRTIRLSGRLYTVTGVMSREFRFDPAPDVWLPFQIDPHTAEHDHLYFTVAARLRPGITLNVAKAQLNLAAERFYRESPDQAAAEPHGGFSASLLRDATVAGIRPTLLVFSGAVGFVLLIACCNVASLLLARASGRRREMAIRASVGAGRGRLIRQLLTENVVLSLLGGALGLAFGMAAVRLLLASDPGGLPRMDEVTLDWRVLAFTFAVALLAGLLIGLLPAIQTSLVDLNSTLTGGDVFRQSRFRSVLVTGEIALAAALLFEAGLLIRAFVTMRAVDPGFDVNSVVAVNTSLADSNIRDASGLGTLLSSATERIRMLPGVLAAGAAWCVPLDPSCAAGIPFKIDGKDQSGRWSSVSPDYFAVLRIPVLRGRPFTLHDNASSPPVVIINDALARQFMRGRDPLNLRLILGSGARTEPPRQIVGVVRDTRDMDLGIGPLPTVYVPLSQLSDAAISTRRDLVPLAWIVRTQGDPAGLRSAIQNTILRASGGLTITSLRTMRQVATESTAAEAFSMLLLTIFGSTALGLAAIGVYGLTAYSVRNRTREFGVRMALGCSAAQLQRSVMLEGLRLASLGVLLGSVAGIGLARSIAHLFYNLEPWDPLVFVAVPVVLGIAALLATWIPARQSSRVDPLLALRCQ